MSRAATNDNVIFCASLPEAFASVAMTYPDKNIEPGKMVRFSTDDKPSDTAGWCRLFPDGVGAVFGCHREGTTFSWQQRDRNASPLSKQELQDARAKFEEVRQQAEHELNAQYARAAKNAARILDKTVELGPAHSYVVRKGIVPFNARQRYDGAVTLSLFAADGTLQSLQFIDEDGEKRFLSQGKMKGGRLFIGKPVNGNPLFLAEGWATACSIHEATGETVVIGFASNNLAVVAADLHRQFPDSPLSIAGDLDTHGKGLDCAQAAAAASAGVVLMPLFADGRKSGDFNDLHQAEGLDAVRVQLSAALMISSHEMVPFIEPCLPKCDARDGTRNTRQLSEYGNAMRLLDGNGDRLKYIHDAQSWIVWDNAAWQWDGGARVRSLAAQLQGTIYSEGARHINDAELFARWARKSQEQRTINASVMLLSDFASVRLPQAYIDADHFTIGFNQAREIIDLRNGATRSAVPADYITKSLSAETLGDATKAVRWMQFLEQVFNNDGELINWMQRFCGYLLTGSTQEQIFLFCFGHGANGKSVFIEVLKHIMADYSHSLASETLSESKRQAGGATPDRAAIIGARLGLCSETEDNTAMAESFVKSLVSGDSMTARNLYAKPVEFKPNIKLVMAGNHKPIVKGTDNGIWRRVRLVPFNRTFLPEERDPHLLDKLAAETPHILAWMVAGCLEWQRHGLADTPETIRQATDAYQTEQDLIGTWLSECTLSTASGETSTTDLYASYRIWCEKSGLKPASKVALGRRLGERGYSTKKSGNNRFWCGLILNDSRRGDYARANGGY